jgi:BON domain
MNEPLFGGPMWSGAPPFGVGWTGMSGPIPLSSRPATVGLLGFGPPQFPQMGSIGSHVPGQQIGNVTTPNVTTLDPYAFGSFAANLQQQPVPGVGFSAGAFAGQQSPFGTPAAFPPLVNPEFVAAYGIPALLAVVAVRRGQPMGPTTDPECEDFIYDALELLPGASEVEVRCEGGRATLTGGVQHKRVKRDVGEIAWAIPAINDVQNNVAIATRRRSRGAGRDSEPHPGGRKQS